MDDRELLRDYVECQSEPAFAELVARHVNLVYATALRIVGEPSAAQDVVQTVFILLARKAWTVRDGNALLGWLYRAAYRAALDAVRRDQRRRVRETEAMILTEQNSTSPEAWEKLAPLLDEAMQRLNRAEQDAVLLRYFEGKTLRETGAALGVSEPAAQMRLSRALDKMRAHFAREGVTVAVGALATVLATNTSKAAPVNLAARVTGPSLAGAGAAGIGGILLRAFSMSTKTKIILAIAVIAVIATTISICLRHPDEPPAIGPGVHIPPVASTPSTAPAPVVANKPIVPARVEAPVVATVSPAPAATTADPAAKPTGDPRASLDTAIPEAIRMLEAQDLDGFYKGFLSGNQKSEFEAADITIEQVLASIHKDPIHEQSLMDQTIKDLRAAQDQTPVMDASGNKATFTIPKNPGDGGPTWVVFNKVDGLWCFDFHYFNY